MRRWGARRRGWGEVGISPSMELQGSRCSFLTVVFDLMPCYSCPRALSSATHAMRCDAILRSARLPAPARVVSRRHALRVADYE